MLTDFTQQSRSFNRIPNLKPIIPIKDSSTEDRKILKLKEGIYLKKVSVIDTVRKPSKTPDKVILFPQIQITTTPVKLPVSSLQRQNLEAVKILTKRVIPTKKLSEGDIF